MRASRLSNSRGLNVKMALIHKINASKRNKHVTREKLLNCFGTNEEIAIFWKHSSSGIILAQIHKSQVMSV